ncbi:MAG: heme exporter protein CcmB, partial [Acidobacteriota bacterium]
AAAGMPRTFLREEETRSADQLRLSTCASSLFCGKALYNLTLLLAVQALVAPLFVGLLRLPVADPGLFAAALLAGGVGLAVASTLIAAIVAQARSSGPLFSVLAFPILLPLLKLSIDATTAATLGEPIGVSLQLALLYDGMVTTAALMLFPVVWNP